MMMKMNNTNIDEINIFNNRDGSYLIKMYMSTTNDCITVTVPKATLDLGLTCDGMKEQSIELKLEGTVDSI